MKPQDRTRAILDSRLAPARRLILVVLSDFLSGDRNTCWPKVETIAARSGYCERQTRELLAELEASGEPMTLRDSYEESSDPEADTELVVGHAGSVKP